MLKSYRQRIPDSWLYVYLSEKFAQNLRVFAHVNRVSKIFAISDFHQKNPAPEKKRGFGLRLT